MKPRTSDHQQAKDAALPGKDGQEEANGSEAGIIKAALVHHLSRFVINSLSKGFEREPGRDANRVKSQNPSKPMKLYPGGISQPGWLERSACEALANFIVKDIQPVPKKVPEHLNHRGYYRQLRPHQEEQVGISQTKGIPYQVLKLAQWQRDLYLIGEGFSEAPMLSVRNDASNVLTYPPSLGEVQLTQLLSWFIPSLTVQQALKPTILYLPSKDGPLRKPLTNVVCNALPMTQSALDTVVRTNLVWALTNPDYRKFVKGHIIRTTYGVSGNTSTRTNTNSRGGSDEEMKSDII